MASTLAGLQDDPPIGVVVTTCRNNFNYLQARAAVNMQRCGAGGGRHNKRCWGRQESFWRTPGMSLQITNTVRLGSKSMPRRRIVLVKVHSVNELQENVIKSLLRYTFVQSTSQQYKLSRGIQDFACGRCQRPEHRCLLNMGASTSLA